jgi:hypothetical protein
MATPLAHPAATHALPAFITAPGESDILFNVVVIVIVVAILAIGNLYFQLHAVPERMAHRTSKVQMEIVAVLALLALFTHNHLYWIAGLLLALIELPDFATPINSIARSLEKVASRDDRTLSPSSAASGQTSAKGATDNEETNHA